MLAHIWQFVLRAFAAAHPADRLLLLDSTLFAFADVPATATYFTEYPAARNHFTKTTQKLVARFIVTSSNLWQFALTSLFVRCKPQNGFET